MSTTKNSSTDEPSMSAMTLSPASLGEVRRQRHVTQAELARRLHVSQAAVSKLEKSKPTVATVRRYIEALGGELEMTASFPDAVFRLKIRPPL